MIAFHSPFMALDLMTEEEAGLFFSSEDFHAVFSLQFQVAGGYNGVSNIKMEDGGMAPTLATMKVRTKKKEKKVSHPSVTHSHTFSHFSLSLTPPSKQ